MSSALKTTLNPWHLDRGRPTLAVSSTFRVVAAFAALVTALLLLPQALSLVPAPIGPSAKQFARGTWTTVQLTLASGVLGLVIGMLAGFARMSKSAIPRGLASFYIWVVRGTPLLLQILFIYFGVPALLGVQVDDFSSAVIALALNVGAYNAEAVRGGLKAVPRGQIEAAGTLGLSHLQALSFVVAPQALRIAMPSLISNGIALLKDSSLAFAIGVAELTLVGSRVSSQTFEPVPVFIASAAVYLSLTTFMTYFAGHLEGRLDRQSLTSRG